MAKKKQHTESDTCNKCKALCCQYVMLELDEPDDRDEFEKIRWYVAHKNISVVHNDEKWYLYVKNPCKYITRDYKCEIYENRSSVCRNHAATDCDFFGEDCFDIHFETIEQVDKHIARIFKKKKKKQPKKPKLTSKKKRNAKNP